MYSRSGRLAEPGTSEQFKDQILPSSEEPLRPELLDLQHGMRGACISVRIGILDTAMRAGDRLQSHARCAGCGRRSRRASVWHWEVPVAETLSLQCRHAVLVSASDHGGGGFAEGRIWTTSPKPYA
jgi:hypothetical protein